jgi:predicted RNA binding protein YcfA (HicA-like mRNA interferase family)
MARLKNWPAKELKKFLEDYHFTEGHTKGSHCYMNGRIKGETRVVQVIFSSHERESQSDKTMKIAIKHSGISQKYFEEWKSKEIVHHEIIY